MTVRISLFNWKWLSEIYGINLSIDSPNQQAGLEEVEVKIDFSELEKTDKDGESLFVAGGRVYFETEVFSTSTSQIIGKGFFDKLGYVEPPAPGKSKLGLILGITIPIFVVVCGVSLYICYKKKEQKKKKAMHAD
jgi:hypothetical protein